MVSFWPFKGDSSSTASFEKTLSTLSVKITETQTRLEKVRQQSRRTRVLGTLYLSFAYLVYAIVLLLVVGYKNLTAYEWTGLAGGPVLIYGTRLILTTYHSFRIEGLSAKLKDQQQERAKTIQKLKDATKYDSTLELIEKYGGTEGSLNKDQAKDGKPSERKGQSPAQTEGSNQQHEHAPRPSRTTMAPPPTANIQRRGPESSPTGNRGIPPSVSSMEPGAEFAPNAEYQHTNPSLQLNQYPSTSPQAQHQVGLESHWYDRVFDLLLGEDETAPKNRIVLLCQSCRLVNGQAPPGAKTTADVGIWRCMACGAQNGEAKEDEGQRIVRQVLEEQKGAAEEADRASESSDDGGESKP